MTHQTSYRLTRKYTKFDSDHYQVNLTAANEGRCGFK